MLGTPLHHEPTRGGPAQGRHFREQYARTLAAYECWFGPPPLAFWPGTQERFADPARWRHVDLHRQLVLPRPRLPGWRGWLSGVGLVGGTLVAGTAAALPLDPFDWTAEPFLELFVALALLALILSSWLRYRLRETGPGRADALDHYQPAYLADGPARAVDTGVTDLLTQGLVRLEESPPRLSLTVSASHLPEPLRELGAAIDRYGTPGAMLLRNATTWHEPLKASLVSRGLALSEQQSWTVRSAGALPLLAVAAFGSIKILVGLSRDRPVGFLVCRWLPKPAYSW
ncbi:TIGR04222 domain-containing membrane protein [uncultured Thiodictyon sp.]|uniref:TIGR04222 domain-containing membrane protein n=1 Tax=uncultured Thiodictyon sp. TaxID=1846217 RepID=UPI0025F0D579|nr:TIGR04222 domain-containing membrane protein [uncultured Thiodictyon sp.]